MITREERQRYAAIMADPKRADWRRPRAEDMAKDLGVLQMYEANYDFNSGYVHPLYGDGNADLNQLGSGTTVEDPEGTLNVLNHACQSLCFMRVTAATGIGGRPAPMLLQALDVFVRWLPGEKPEDAEETLAALKAAESETLIGFP